MMVTARLEVILKRLTSSGHKDRAYLVTRHIVETQGSRVPDAFDAPPSRQGVVTAATLEVHIRNADVDLLADGVVHAMRDIATEQNKNERE